MRLEWGLLAAAMVVAAPAMADGGTWKFEVSATSDRNLSYTENGKTIFVVGCGEAFGVHARYPGQKPKAEGSATVYLSSGKGRMALPGEIEDPGAGSADFVQWNLGFKAEDPELFGKRWQTAKSLLLGLLESGQPVKVSAGKGSYEMPPVNAAGWRSVLDACKSK